jgi:hypothetical protein
MLRADPERLRRAGLHVVRAPRCDPPEAGHR